MNFLRVIYRRASHAAASLPLCFARIKNMVKNCKYTGFLPRCFLLVVEVSRKRHSAVL